MKKIGIISDTHNCFDDDLRKFLDPVDEIWHAGDIGSQETADRIAAFKPLRAVHGNIDGGTTRIIYPELLVWDCEFTKVMMTHIGGYPGKYDRRIYHRLMVSRPGLFIAGHSHILKIQYDRTNKLLFINPGAAGCYGSHKVRTAVRMVFDGSDMRDLEVVEWERTR